MGPFDQLFPPGYTPAVMGTNPARDAQRRAAMPQNAPAVQQLQSQLMRAGQPQMTPNPAMVSDFTNASGTPTGAPIAPLATTPSPGPAAGRGGPLMRPQGPSPGPSGPPDSDLISPGASGPPDADMVTLGPSGPPDTGAVTTSAVDPAKTDVSRRALIEEAFKRGQSGMKYGEDKVKADDSLAEDLTTTALLSARNRPKGKGIAENLTRALALGGSGYFGGRAQKGRDTMAAQVEKLRKDAARDEFKLGRQIAARGGDTVSADVYGRQDPNAEDPWDRIRTY